MLKVAFLCVFIQISDSSFTPFPPIDQWRVLVPEIAVVQGAPAHYTSPITHDKSIRESFHPDRGEEYVNDHAAQDDEQSAMELFKRNLNRASSISRYEGAPDLQPTTTATDVPSTGISYPLPVSPACGSSREDVIINDPSTVPRTGIGEHLSIANNQVTN